MRHRSSILFLIGALTAALSPPTDARTLAASLLVPIENRPQGNLLVAELVRTAVLGADFPSTPTTPSVVFTYDVATGTFERSPSSLGPTFVERGETTGAHRFTFGLSYLYVDFDKLDGENLERNQSRDVLIGDEIIRDELNLDSFTLSSHVFGFSGTYGVTDSFDVNVLVPLVYSGLDVRGTVTTGTTSGSFEDLIDVGDSKVGVGDVLLRAKYRLTPTGSRLKVGTGLALRTPSGEAENFQGLGDWIITPFLAGSSTLGLFGVHGNLSIDANADDLERSRIRWGIGATAQLGGYMALLLEVFGNSAFVEDRFTEFNVSGRIQRSDNVFTASGMKLHLGDRATLYAIPTSRR